MCPSLGFLFILAKSFDNRCAKMSGNQRDIEVESVSGSLFNLLLMQQASVMQVTLRELFFVT